MWLISCCFHRCCSWNSSFDVPSSLGFHLWLFLEWTLYWPKDFVPLYITQTAFPIAYFSSIPSPEQLLLLCKEKPHSAKFSAKALIDVPNLQHLMSPLCPVLLSESFHCRLMNDLETRESPQGNSETFGLFWETYTLLSTSTPGLVYRQHMDMRRCPTAEFPLYFWAG